MSSINMYNDRAKLASAIEKLTRNGAPLEFLAWPNPALNVLDCVLSLNRRYDTFVLPRVSRFSECRPRIDGLASLARLIRSYDSPGAFSIAELNYNHPTRAEVILAVTQYLLRMKDKFAGPTEAARLQLWAKSSQPNEHSDAGISGFGLAGFQYLRMLFGADTAKPDRHIVNFVSKVIGHSVTAERALTLLEETALVIDIPIRNVDYAIWAAAARNIDGTAKRGRRTCG